MKPWSKACREKSAEAIVPREDRVREGPNLTEGKSVKRLTNEGTNAENIDKER